ncbi:MAG: hypothetical protein ACFFAK_14205 [Promethearchaeota archaeon]
MSNKLKQIKDLEPVKEDKNCFCTCVSSNESANKRETTLNEDCCE